MNDINRVCENTLCHKAYQKHKANLYVKLGPHKHHFNRQATMQYNSPVYVEIPQFMASLNMCIISTHYVHSAENKFPQNSELR